MGYVVRMIHGAETSLRISTSRRLCQESAHRNGWLALLSAGELKGVSWMSAQQQLTNGNRKQISPTGNGDVLLFFLWVFGVVREKSGRLETRRFLFFVFLFLHSTKTNGWNPKMEVDERWSSDILRGLSHTIHRTGIWVPAFAIKINLSCRYINIQSSHGWVLGILSFQPLLFTA